MPTLGVRTPPSFRSTVSQITAANRFKSTLQRSTTSSYDNPPTPRSSVTEDDLNDDITLQETELELDFSAASHFVQSYQGPHTILKQENSQPKLNFYALYQQATVGPCINHNVVPNEQTTSIDIAKWEKWQQLGHMSREEAMEKYIAILDNLVDDWRRTTNQKIIHTTSLPITTGRIRSVSAAANPRSYHKAASMFDRSPKLHEEIITLKAHLGEEKKKRESIESRLTTYATEQRNELAREVRQIDQLWYHLTTLVKSLEQDVKSQQERISEVTNRDREISEFVQYSSIFALERRIKQVLSILGHWMQNKTLRYAVFTFIILKTWIKLTRSKVLRRLPQVIAQFLIRWLSSAASLET